MSKVSNVTEPNLARLLSGRDEPSVLEKEAALQRVLAQVSPKSRRWPWDVRVGWAAALPALGAAAAAVAMVFYMGDSSQESGNEFQSRGTDASASLSIRCVSAGAATAVSADAGCARGTVMGFAASPPADKPYFAAFSQRSDGTVLWYLPSPGETSEPLTPGDDGVAVVPRGVPVGGEHSAGTYEVFGVFSSSPLSRAQLREILGPELDGRTDPKRVNTVAVARRKLEILP